MTFIVKTFMFMQKIYFLLLIVFGGIFTASAQLVTTTPDFPLEGKENEPVAVTNSSLPFAADGNGTSGTASGASNGMNKRRLL